MKKLNSLFSMALALCIASHTSFAQNKVVVIPLAGDSIDSNLLPIVNSVVAAEGVIGAIAGFGIRDFSRPGTGVYLLNIEDPGNFFPIIHLTVNNGGGKIANYEVDPDFRNVITVNITEADGTTMVDSSFSITVFSNPLPL